MHVIDMFQPGWTKMIKEEWRILEEQLPGIYAKFIRDNNSNNSNLNHGQKFLFYLVQGLYL